MTPKKVSKNIGVTHDCLEVFYNISYITVTFNVSAIVEYHSFLFVNITFYIVNT